MNTISSKPLRTLVAGALLSALTFSFAVHPAVADSSDVQQITVKFGDLNIWSPAGAAALYGRIRTAASEVCRQFGGTGVDGLVQKACIDRAIVAAVSKVNAPSLSAVFASKSGVSPPMVLAATATR